MSGRLEHKTALVTGAGQGIGRAVAEAFAREGGRVWATSRSRKPLQQLASAAGITTYVLDVTRPAAVAQAGRDIGPIDVLVNCAGYVPSGALLDCPQEELDRAIDVNLRGAYFMIRTFLPAMLAGGGGSIVNIGSVLSSISAAAGRFAYGASKAALIGLTKSVAVDYVAQGVRCNAVCPGAVQTPGLEARIAATVEPEATRRSFVARHRMGRLGTPTEIAAACVYLAADESAFMTGQTIVIDGGMTL
jgi:2-keto-3-deoxy-L-fuconate dehydrogenase